MTMAVKGFQSMPARRLWLLAIVILIVGCSAPGYYLRSAEGQVQLLRARLPIAELIADPATAPALRARLERVLEIRDFATRELKLPDNQSYRGYADLRRPFVVWNVFAAPEFSLTLRQWCFPFAGCVSYRGYFSQAEAEGYAAELAREGLDVFVSGVPAYSTLGWFDDPVLNTFVNYPEHELARLIFHELAHQVVYVQGDSEFNESFAGAVEVVGVRRWLERNSNDELRAEFERAQIRRDEFRDLISNHRVKLTELYERPLAFQEMRQQKSLVFSQLQSDYQALKVKWQGFAGYDRFFERANNARFGSVALYNALVPSFLKMIAQRDGDLTAFYSDVRELARLDKSQRSERLAALKE